MSKEALTDEEIEKLVDLELKTRNQARIYISEKLEIGRGAYYRRVYPIIKDEFKKRFKNDSCQGYRIPKRRLDEIVANFNKKVVDHVEEVKMGKDF